jgi:transposase
MHIRYSTSRRKGKVYRTPQLVQSFRRPDGMPAHRVIASLKGSSELEIENLRRALRASRAGVPVLVSDAAATAMKPWKPQANLRYLDIAVVLHVLRWWGLDTLLEDLLPERDAQVPYVRVVEALVSQRCVAPASKLAATRWYGRTALPELQAVRPRQFNNTRLHRVLEDLETVEVPLQERLSSRIRAKEGAFAFLFLDCTDTWFEGRGPPLAHVRTSKEGLLRRLVGIVLLCDHRGYPLRWATVAGNHDESVSMMGTIRRVADLPWVREVPLVVDRAMGRSATVGALLTSGVRFVTAVPVHELASYSHRIPFGLFDDVQLTSEEHRPCEDDLARLLDKAEEAGFVRMSDRRCLLDLGVFDRGETDVLAGKTSRVTDGPSRAVAALRIARRLRGDLDAGLARGMEELAERHGCTRHVIAKWLGLLDLDAAVQERILLGDADRVSPGTLTRIATLPPKSQPAVFEEAINQAGDGAILRPAMTLARLTASVPFEVRGIVLFNPEHFIEQRLASEKRRSKLESFVDALNEKLRSPRCRIERDGVLTKVAVEIRHHRLTAYYEVEVRTGEHEGRQTLEAGLLFDAEAWKRRRRTDGLNLVVAQRDTPASAAEIVQAYFAKDAVEKDFQAIKSVMELRPVGHRTDPKVRAHVTLCMLALLVERTIERRLREAGLPMTASTALDTLGTCHLNQYVNEDTTLYNVTELSPDQRKILLALGCPELEDDEWVAGEITHR